MRPGLSSWILSRTSRLAIATMLGLLVACSGGNRSGTSTQDTPTGPVDIEVLGSGSTDTDMSNDTTGTAEDVADEDPVADAVADTEPGIPDADGPGPVSDTVDASDPTPDVGTPDGDDIEENVPDIPEAVDVCGDGSCDESEHCENCAADCGVCTPCDLGQDATDEICNGIDDDCDDNIDEDVAADCDDGIACTDDVCGGESGCVFTPDGESCLIDEICYDAGDINPIEPCQECSPSDVEDDWAWTIVGTCEDNDPCTEDELCVLGFCVGSAVQDVFEPNDNQSMANSLGSVEDDDDYPAGSVEATLFGDEDVDWFTFFDDDKSFGSFHPRIDLTVPAGVNYRLCMYFVCNDGSTPTIDGCEGGDPAESADGLAGCCANAPGDPSLELSVNCPGLDDSGDIFAEVVRFTGDPTCAPYTLTWGDD